MTAIRSLSDLSTTELAALGLNHAMVTRLTALEARVAALEEPTLASSVDATVDARLAQRFGDVVSYLAMGVWALGMASCVLFLVTYFVGILGLGFLEWMGVITVLVPLG